MKILLVDDDSDNLRLVRRLLETEGMTVRCATSGEDALWELKSNVFDVMITDLNMPEMDGLALSRKAAVIAPDMPIVMFTGAISPEVMAKARDAGIITVLAKPFHPNEMLDAIRSASEEQRKRAVFTEKQQFTCN